MVTHCEGANQCPVRNLGQASRQQISGAKTNSAMAAERWCIVAPPGPLAGWGLHLLLGPCALSGRPGGLASRGFGMAAALTLRAKKRSASQFCSRRSQQAAKATASQQNNAAELLFGTSKECRSTALLERMADQQPDSLATAVDAGRTKARSRMTRKGAGARGYARCSTSSPTGIEAATDGLAPFEQGRGNRPKASWSRPQRQRPSPTQQAEPAQQSQGAAGRLLLAAS